MTPYSQRYQDLQEQKDQATHSLAQSHKRLRESIDILADVPVNQPAPREIWELKDAWYSYLDGQRQLKRALVKLRVLPAKERFGG